MAKAGTGAKRAPRAPTAAHPAETRRVRPPRRQLGQDTHYGRTIGDAQANPRWRASAREQLAADLALLREQERARKLFKAARTAVMRLGDQMDRYAAAWQAKGFPPPADTSGTGASMWAAIMELKNGPSRFGPAWSIEHGYYVPSAATEFVGRASQWITDDDLIAEVLDPVAYRAGRKHALNAIAKRREEHGRFVAAREADLAAHARGDTDARERMRRPPPKRSRQA